VKFSNLLQIHVNGFVSLDFPPYPAWYPHFSSRLSVIAPFWTDIDLRSSDGVVYFNHILRSSAEEIVAPQAAELFDATKYLVQTGAGDASFLPTEVITVTWQNVSQYPAFYYASEVCNVLVKFSVIFTIQPDVVQSSRVSPQIL